MPDRALPWSRRATVDRLALALVALAGAVAVFLVATETFAYRSVNDDEGVYLMQAAMLLEGRLFLDPGAYGASVRPWFFVADPVADGVRYYPKYAPVAAAVFAAGMLAGDATLALAAVAAGSVALVGVLAADAFDRRTGVAAAVALVTAPLFLVTGATFLSYAPTTLATLAFAVAYVRSYRADTPRRRASWGLLAGLGVGVAFFSRPYTALYFAAPFVAHTLVRLARAREAGPSALRAALVRSGATALVGVAFVAVTLGYNAAVTGDPLTFPYEAFAPRDGVGFGRRAILGYEETYTPALAVESTLAALRRLALQWGPAAPVGTALALLGALSYRAPRGSRRRRSSGPGGGATTGGVAGMTDREVRLLLAGVAVAIVLGEAYFWGTLNGLRNGLIDLLGPFYHFGLLVPVAAFAGAGATSLLRGTRAAAARRLSPSEARGVVLVVLLLSASVAGFATATSLAEPLRENGERTENLAAAYEPFQRERLEDAVVLLADPYGDWVAHPFQALRNDPGLDGPVVYAADGPPARDLRVLTATDRTPYRYTYRGVWTGAVTPIEPELRRLEVLRGPRVDATTTVGVPAGARTASVRVETDAGYARYEATVPDAGAGDSLRVDWSVTPAGVAVDGRARAAGPRRVPLPGEATTVRLLVTFVDDAGSSVTYRQELTVDVADGEVRAVWPPITRVCRLTTDCGREATWVGPDADYLSGVRVDATASATGANGSGNATANATASLPAPPRLGASPAPR
jgi:hypothetical protein